MDLSLAACVQQRFPQHTLAVQRYRGQESLVLLREGLLDAARFLRDDPALQFDILMDLTCVDYLKFGRMLQSAPTLTTPSPLPYYMKPKPVAETWQRPVSNDQYRFETVYHFFSSVHHHRLRVKVPLPAIEPRVDSLTPLWATANWFEREVWDMFGVIFTGHPDLRRILMYDAFTGHPLRKDYAIAKRQPIIGPMN